MSGHLNPLVPSKGDLAFQGLFDNVRGILVVALGGRVLLVHGTEDRAMPYTLQCMARVLTQCQQCLDGESLPYPGIHIQFSSEIPLLP